MLVTTDHDHYSLLAELGESYQSNHPLEKKQWVEVLVDCPGVIGLFTYRLPVNLEVNPGDILSVPFGTQQVGAIAIRLIAQPPPNLPLAKIRDIEDIITTGFFPPTYWELLERVAAYYYTPLIQVIKTALPPGLLGRSQLRIRLTQTDEKPEKFDQPGTKIFLTHTARQIWQLLQVSPTRDYTCKYIQRQVKGADRGLKELVKHGLVERYLEPPKAQRSKQQKAIILVTNNSTLELTSRQQEVLEILKRQGGEMWLTQFLQIPQVTDPIVKKLVQKGCVILQEREVLRIAKSPDQEADQPKILTNNQQSAVAEINKITGYAKILLHGVTGSGKTEVYLQAIAPIITSGKSALVLVPEIGLTPQLTDRFKARFGEKVYVYHSGLSAGERFDTWRQMLMGEPQIIIGTRSAIFAPLPQLGLIILDEEYDSSYKQDQPIPTYHARTVANWRAELENCPLVLGSATPSLETWVDIAQNCINKEPDQINYYLSLPERIQARPMPPIEVVDMRRELRLGNRSIFSLSLQSALKQLSAQKQQGILFIHRRGHSTFVSCRSCGYVIECPNCDVSLAYHYTDEGATQLLRCHYCNYVQLHPDCCPECTSPYLKNFGSGTQRVEEELKRDFPQLRSIRFDSDTTRTKDAHRILLTKFANGEADLLIGTQMLTKGLDLPQVTLVGVVAADGLLNLADYRASERGFQTLTQVAGRAGRGADPGRVILQTYTPDHPVILAVKRHEYESFIETELQTRRYLNYPPYGRLILLRLSGIDEAEVEQTAQNLAQILQPADDALILGYEVLGPAPATIMRIANRYRWQILLKFSPQNLVKLPDWEQLRDRCPPSVNLTIDVDPLNVG